jgi:RND family efflux transporter MFP subunit
MPLLHLANLDRIPRYYLSHVSLAMAGIALLVLGPGCNHSTPGVPTQVVQPTTPTVTVVHPERRTVRRLIQQPGYNIEPYQRTPIYAKLAAYVGKVRADIGDRVEKGQVLAVLRIPELEMELQQKEAAVRQAEAEITQAQAAVLRARAEHRRAQSQYERMARLGQSGVTDRENIEETRFGFEAAEAAVAKAQADVTVARARRDVAKADRDHVKALLGYTEVVAPFKGVVTQRRVDVDHFVQPADASGKGEPLFVVDQTDPVRVFVNVPELEAVWVTEGAKTVIRAQARPGMQFEGQVTRTSRALSPRERTLRTEIDLPNPQDRLLPGTFVYATIVAEHRGVWSLPVAAVVTKGDESFCYRVSDGRVRQTPLQVGLRGETFVEVLKQQVAREGAPARWDDPTGREVIVSNPPQDLKDGQAVAIPAAKAKQ